MSLKERIQQDLKQAMRQQEKARVGAIRLLNAAIKQREVDERITLDDAAIIAVVDKMVKQRRDSLQQYEAAGRGDLADQERFEIELLQTYLPAPLSDDELDSLVREAIAETGATGMKDMRRVMGVVKPKAQGRADMGAVSARVKAALSA